MSVIDRWATHPLLIKAIGSRILDEIKKFSESEKNDVIILFSAHSLPLKVRSCFKTCLNKYTQMFYHNNKIYHSFH